VVVTGMTAATATATVRFEIVHRTVYRYDAPVSSAYNTAHLTPRATATQRCVSTRIDVDPVPADRSTHVDHFGNEALYVAIHEPHQHLAVTATSVVDVTAPAVDRVGAPEADLSWTDAVEALIGTADVDTTEAQQFVLPSPHVSTPVDALTYAAGSFPPGTDVLAGALDLMGRIHREFEFDPGATTTSTPVDEVLAHGRGVCQDFAHLMIAGLRALGLPARYVSGYLETEPPPGSERLVGVDASHAWVSLFVPRIGWIDLDPTNDVIPAERHVTLAWGRDYGDVAPLTGVIFTGHGGHELSVAVDVRRLDRTTR
jgi:transglutaminase-like putative cysteine protease